jgi:hypothetical protein
MPNHHLAAFRRLISALHNDRPLSVSIAALLISSRRIRSAEANGPLPGSDQVINGDLARKNIRFLSPNRRYRRRHTDRTG